jgi:uncharacterized repeat protein (TIGR01451 family)
VKQRTQVSELTRKLFERFGRHNRRTVAAATALAVAALCSVIFVAGSGATLAPPATFEGNDGNLVVNSTADWASFPINCATGAGCLVDTPSGSSDNAFGQGTQEDDTSVTVVDGSIPPNKNDLTRSYITSEVLGGNTYLYLAWERAVNTGSANIDFELNQNPTPGFDGSTGSFALTRTAGDILIAYDFGGSGTPTISLLRWVTSGPGSQCDKSNTTPCWGKRVDMTAAGFAEAQVNTGPVSDPFLSNTANNVGTGLFGEAALNLSSTELHVFEPHTCRAFGDMFVKSRASGSSIDAELKDFIAPAPIHVSNCGSIELKKHWAGTPDNATLNIGTSSGGNQTATQAVNGADGTTGAKSVEDGTYFVSESGVDSSLYNSTLACTDNGNGVTPGANNSLGVSAGHTVACTFTNARKQGTIQLRKHWVGTPGNASLAVGSTGPGSGNVTTGSANGADGNTAVTAVDTGTYYLSEQYDSSLYTTSLACSNGGSSVSVGPNDSVSVGDGQNVVCTYTNTRRQGSIELKKSWVGTKGNVTLNIGTAAGGSQVDTQALVGADGTTGADTVDTGTYYVSESFDSPSTADQYTSALACTDNGNAVAPGANQSVAVADGHTVVCTYTNTRNQGSIELKKHWVGTAGNATLNIGTSAGGSQVDTQAANGADASTGANTVDSGTHFVSESGVDSNLYASTLACTDNGQAVTPGAAQSLAVAGGHTVVCTFTNTRKTGSIELGKAWVGTKGNVTLKIGTAAGGSQVDSQALVGADGTTGPNTVDTGTYFVSESFDSPTKASDYTTSLVCTDNGNAVTPGAGNSLAVADGHTLVCTFTNTRKTGSVEVKKTWNGLKGNVTLKIGTGAGGSQVDSQALVGADGTTGPNTVDTGTYFVSESFDSPTDASDYTTSLACTDNGQTVSPGAGESLPVADGHTIVCTFTNTRKTGSIEVKKTWVGLKGNVTLAIGTSEGGNQVASQALVGADGTTGPNTVDTGTYFVSESFDSPTNAADYTTSLACTDNGNAVTPGAGQSLPVADGHAVVCTFTNSRNPGSIELRKAWIGTKGDVTLNVGSSAGAGDVASKELVGVDGTTGANTVAPATYYVSEDFVSPSSADQYATTLACTDNGQAIETGPDNGVAVASNHTVVCTLTNTRKSGSIELKKAWIGDKGNVTLDIGTTAGGSQVDSKALVGADGTTGEQKVDTGTYFVSESFDSPTSAADYDTTLACTDNGTPIEGGAENGLFVSDGHAIVCTFTNSRLPQVKLVKSLQPANDDGTFDLSIGEQSFTNGGKGYGDGGTTNFVNVPQGSAPVVSESGHGDTSLDDYDSSVQCSNEQSGDGTSLDLNALQYGDKVTCTFTNIRRGTIKIVKHALGGSATFDYTLRQQGDEGSTPFQLSASAGSDDSKAFSVSPGDYAVVEAPLDGWANTSLSCSTGGSQDASNPSQASIHIGAGDVVTCTYTNTKLATLIVKKLVDNSNGGGSKAPADFTIHVTQGIELPGSPKPGSSEGTTYSGLLPGTYNVTEDAVSGYSLTKIEGCLAGGSITLDAGQTATCTLTNTSAAPPPPPPPPPPAPKVDIQITKSATPNPATVGHQVTWTMVVTNNGPNNATGVTVADPVPAGMTFVSVASSAGTCTGGALVSCQLGNLNVGGSVTITLVTTAAATGTITNTATTVANEQETNTANNTASANVTVNGAFVPPVTSCTAVAVSPKQLFVGRKNTLTLKTTQHGKAKGGVKVRVKGSTIGLTTKPSNGKGVIKQQVKPTKAGIVVFTPVAAKSCKNPRIGVIGVFTPPVTG